MYKSRHYLYTTPSEHVVHEPNRFIQHKVNADNTVDFVEIDLQPKASLLDCHAFDVANLQISNPDLLKPVGKVNLSNLENHDSVELGIIQMSNLEADAAVAEAEQII